MVAAGAVGWFLWGPVGRPKDLAALRAALRADFPDVVFLRPDEWVARTSDSTILLDVRDEAEYAVSHLPGAVRAEADPVAQLRAAGATPDTPIGVYCSVGLRSARLARTLQAAGFRKVANLDGSLFAWAEEGLPMVNDRGPTDRVHPYDYRWGRYLARDRWAWTPTNP